MGYSNKNIFKLIITSVALALELFYLLVCVQNLYLSITDSDMFWIFGDYVIFVIHAVILICLSVSGILRLEHGCKPMLFSGFLLKIVVTMIADGSFLLLTSADRSTAKSLIFSGIVMGAIIIWGRYSNGLCIESNKKSKFASSRIRFEKDKAKYHWDLAAEEYCRIKGKSLETLTSDDNDKIYEYAGNPIAYFLAWIIKNDFIGEGFDADYLNEVKAEKSSAAEFFRDQLDCGLSRGELADKILPFVDSYYILSDYYGFYSDLSRRYYDDYYEVIRNDNNIFYCIDFSWDIYHKIEERINDKYKYYLMSDEEVDCDDIRELMVWKLFNSQIAVCYAEGVSWEYVEKCKNHLNNLSESVIYDLCKKLIDICQEEIPEVKENKRHILKYLVPDMIKINTPCDETPAFIVECDCEFEDEHGIAWVVRGDEILEMGYRSDVESPWSHANELAYRIATSIRNINPIEIASNDKAVREAEKGNLEPLYLMPVMLGGQEAEHNRVFAPTIIVELKHRYDIMIENLLRQGRVDSYSCSPRYKGTSFVPYELRIEAKKEDKIIFAETIHIWG